jgi:hypothetical protein
MSSDDESTTAYPEPRYQLQSNTQSFEPISLSSRSLRWYHQASTAPSSSNTTLTGNSGSCYTHQWYIKVHLEGLISGVHLLLHLLSHHHRIFRCKSLRLHPYTPWRLAISLRELRSFDALPSHGVKPT